jgi:hypothetical protein
MMMDEGRLVVHRVNVGYATQAVLLQMAVSGVLSKKGNKAFQKQVKTMMEE